MGVHLTLAVVIVLLLSNTEILVVGVCTVSNFKALCLNQTGTNRATYFNGFCWVLHPQPAVSWSVAQTACTSEHPDGRSAVITRKDEFEALKSVLDAFSDVWVALERDASQPMPEDGWQYVNGDGSKAFVNGLNLWAKGEPIAGDNAIVNHRGLGSRNSGNTYPFLCQIPEPAGCPNRACFDQLNAGSKGSVAQGDIVLDTVTDVNIHYCTRLCAEERNCQSLAHSTNARTCIMYWLDAKDLSLESDPDYQILNKHTIEKDCQTLQECIKESKIMLFGAKTSPGHTTVESFYPDSPAANQIETTMPDGRFASASGLIAGNSILLCGGKDGVPSASCYFYDLAQKTFLTAPDMINARVNARGITVDHTLYVCGGSDGTAYIAQCEKYSTATQSWESISSMNRARGTFPLAYINGYILAIGGYRGTAPYMDSVERYNIETDTWDYVAPLPRKTAWMAAATLDGFVYSCGGNDHSGVFHTACQKYDHMGDAWIAIADMNVARIGHGLVSFNGGLIALGGHIAITSVEVYDPITNTWTLSPTSLIQGRHAPAVIVV